MPKIWLAFFFGYNGLPFNGMQFQIQSHLHTVEGVLTEKFYKNGFLLTNHHGMLQRNERWSRAARTDKGVHAIMNGISCLFNIDNMYFDEDKTLNKNHLDLAFRELFEGSEVTYHCFKRVTTRFEIRFMIKSRHYAYLCPKEIIYQTQKPIASKTQQPLQINHLQKQAEGIQENKEAQLKDHSSSSKGKSEEELLQKLNECCQQFVGTHNFHNYSKNLKAKDAQAQRYILNFKISDYNKDYFLFELQGQSFIYHQIRKMIGCIIMIMVNHYPSSYIQNTFFRNQIHMPLAPAEGLFLKGINFDAYNKKKDIPEPLSFDNIESIGLLKDTLTQYITQKDLDSWREWLRQLKESIYHGITFEQQDKHEGKEINDD